MSEARANLVGYMSELSERCYCAGWMEGTERVLRDPRVRVWGMERLTWRVRLRLLGLWVRAGFWWPRSYEQAAPYLDRYERRFR